jgi:hypothetical protein
MGGVFGFALRDFDAFEEKEDIEIGPIREMNMRSN